MIRAIQEVLVQHGTEQKKEIKRILQRDTRAVFRIERKVIRHLGLSMKAWEDRVRDKLEMAEKDIEKI